MPRRFGQIIDGPMTDTMRLGERLINAVLL